MLPKDKLKKIAQLGQKKFREQTGLFVVEGQKSVLDFLDQGWVSEGLYSTKEIKGLVTQQVSEKEMQRMTQFKTASPLLGVFRQKHTGELPITETALILDGLNDPGNLGTILRQASWFGISHVVCSPNTVDAYNPKVVQASMGGLARVGVHYTDLESFLNQSSLTVYGFELGGQALSEISWQRPAHLVFGSESHGISAGIAQKLSYSLTIPSYGLQAVESLNVASASAIVLADFCR